MAFKDWLKEYRETQGSQPTTSKASTSGTSKQSTSGSAGSGSSGSSFRDTLKEYREAQAGSSLQGWAETSFNLIKDIQSRSSNWYDENAYKSSVDSFTSLLSQADNWRKQYGGNSDAVSYIDSVVKALSDAKTYSYNARKYYSQWKTGEEYNAYVAQQKEYEEKKNFDLNTGRKEIEDLERSHIDFDTVRTQYVTAINNPEAYTQAQLKDITSRYKDYVSKYGSVEKLDSLISEKKAYLNQSKHIQEGITLAGAAGNADFKEYSGYVSTKSDDLWGKLTSQYGMKYDDLTYEYINNQNGIRDEIKQKNRSYSADSGDGESTFEEKGYDYMTEDEVAIYNYYYAKDGKKAADKYLNSIQESLSLRKATGMYKNMEDKTLLELAFGVAAGLDQFESGMKNLFNTEDDYIAQTATQMASGMVREDLADAGAKLPDWMGGASLGQMGYDAITTTANMAPSILTSVFVGIINPMAGEIVGASLMGASASGNAYQEALNLGYGKDQARGYANLIGASEAVLGYLMGGISKLGGKLSNKAIEGFLSNVDNALLRTAGKLGGKMLSEFSEEYLQEVLTPVFSNLMLGTDEEIRLFSAEALYSGLLGALTAGIMEGGGVVKGEVNAYTQGKALKAADISATRLAELGQTFSADTVAYQLAGRVNENTGAYTMGRLFNEIGATLSEQNVTEITEALVAKGMDTATARKNANALAYVVEGGQLTDRQVAVIEANEVLAEVARTTLIDANTTWNQRSKGYNDMLKALADEMTSPKASRTNPAQQSQENAPASDTVDTQNESGVESLSGADTVDIGPVKVKNISTIKNGQVTIKLEDDSEVDVKKADLSPEDGVRIETIASIDGISVEDANFVLNTLRTSTNASAQMDALGAKETFKYGFYGFSQDHIAKHGVFANSLTETQRQAIYEAGKKARQKQIEQATPKKAKSATTGIYFDAGNGNVVPYSESNMTALDKKQSAGVQTAMILHKLGIGGDIYFFKSYINAQGRRVYKDKNGKEVSAPNGWYSPGDGSIHIDLNAGNKGDGYVLYTLAHELTHFIEQWSASKYKILADFLVENYEKGQSMDKLVRAKQAKLSSQRGKPVPYKEAYSEVIADSMEAMLADGNVLEKLIELRARDNDIFMKMKQFFDNLLTKIRNAYKGLTPDSNEGKAVLEMTDSIEKLQQLFAEALVDAGENYQSSEQVLAQAGISVNAETDSGSLLSVRDVLSEADRNKVAKALADRFKVTEKEAKEWLKAETSLASLILNPKYSMFLDYEADPNEVAIKQNSDYPQGTVDFSNICKKRREFTQVMNRILRNFPNHVFAATDLAKIRTIMGEEGMTLPCGICYVEDRRQLDSIVAQDFVNGLKLYREGSKTRPDGKPFNANQLKGLKLTDGDDYVPTIYELVTLEGRNSLKAKNPNMEAAWVKYNNARGMQSVRLLTNEAEYKRQILKYNKNTVKSKNDKGGLRIYSFSDMEMFHLIDIIQVITDSATVGLSIQGYTKVNEYAKAVKDTGLKLNRSLIPKGDLGYHMENGKIVLDYDPVEGIDIHSDDFFDSTDNPNVGNITIGINDTQIRAAMISDFVDYIIPFHTGQSEEVLGEKGIAAWDNYKDFQTEKDLATGTTAEHQINIYTEVFQAAEAEGKPIQNKRQFVEKFLAVCKENGLKPRFAQFLNTDANGDYIYTEGYHKFLVDFKTFAQTEVGEYLPQMPVKPIFDNAYMTSLLEAYVEEQQVKDAEVAKQMPKVIERITNEIIKPDMVVNETDAKKFSDRDYSYEAMVSKPDMVVTEVGGNVPKNRADIIAMAKKNATSVGRFDPKTGSVSVHVVDIGRDVVLGTVGLKHGLEGRREDNAIVTLKAGEILHNSIRINELTPKKDNAEGSYVLIGAARGSNGDLYIVRSVVNTFKHELVSMDVLYAINAKKGNRLRSMRPGFQGPVTDSTISIAELLDYVNQYFPDILPEEVLKHYGYDARPEGSLGEDALYSDRDNAPTFYSHMARVVEGVKQEKLGAASVVSMLRGKGVKAEEIKWSGIEEWLAGKKSVTKAELQEFIAGSMLQIVEEQSDTSSVALRFKGNDTYKLYDAEGNVLDTFIYNNFMGGYISEKTDEIYSYTYEIEDAVREEYGSQSLPRWADYKLNGGSNYREIVFRLPNNSYSNQAMRVHWGDDAEGVLAHARIQDFNVNGKQMLFVEELQSDYHNEGHESGYADSKTEKKIEALKAVADARFFALEDYSTEMTGAAGEWDTVQRTVEGAKLLLEYREAQDAYDNAMDEFVKKIPDAPFKDTYHEYVMKRLIRMAAEQDYDSIGWTPSEIQVKRWSEDFAEGYRIEYDQEIPKFLNKYGKKWGASVGKTVLDNGTEVWSMFITDEMKESALTEGQPLYQDRDTDSVSNRSLLANAFEGVAKDDLERNKIREYKGQIDLINAEERKLSELNEKIRELSFAKGPKDTKAIRDLQFEARQTANRINTYDKILLRLEASKPLQDVLAREKKLAYQKAEKQGKEALAAYKERAAKTQRELMDRWQESRKRGIESREKTFMRHKIQSVVGELNQLLLSNDKKRHVPDSLKKAVADALALVNMDTVGAEERAAKYAALIAKETDPDKIDAYTMTMENILRQGDKMGQRLKELRDAYEEIQDSDDPDIANAYDPVIAGSLKELAGSIGNTSLRNMTIEQLSDVYDMYKMVLTRVRDANKSFLNEKKEAISALASRVVGEVKVAGGEHKYRAAFLDFVRKFGWNNLKPVYAFEHIGSSTLTGAFNNVRKGEDVWAIDVTEAREYYLDKSKKYGYDSWDFKKKYRFESASGLEFELTLDQILSLYAYSKREQAHEHLKLGGFVFDSNIETYKEQGSKIIKYRVNTADAHQITPDILANIISNLSGDQKGFVDEMQDYLSTVMGAKGNEITMKMYGVKLFKEKFYFPLKSAKQFMFEQNEVSGEVRIKNSGFTNKVVAHANNPVILSNFMDVWSGHVNDMSMYHAFVLPLEDFNRIFNYNSPKLEGQPPVSVKGTIQSAYTPAAVSYVKQLITDLNGGARSDPATGPLNWLMGKFKKGSVFASLSVVVQQPSAIARAAALVDTKYFIGPKVDHKRHKALWDEVKKYAPVAIIKEMGYFDTNMGKSTQDFITAKEHDGWLDLLKRLDVKGLGRNAKDFVVDSDYRDEVLSWGPAFADELAWCSIWEAVKREMHDKHSGLDVNSEPFLMLCGSRFTEVITKTQVYDSVLSRSAHMRSKDTGMKMVTAFMAEPTTSINMIADALLQGKRGNRKYCRAAIGAVIASQILNSILVSFVYAGRDDDEEEAYWEKYIGTLTGEILDGLNPAEYIPFIKDIVSIAKGYDVERSDMAVFSDLVNAIQKLGSDKLSVYRKVEGFAGSIAQIFGLPVKNIMRDVRGIYQTIDSFVNGQQTTGAGIGYAVKGAITGKTASDQQQLYEAYMSGDKEHITRVSSRYKDQNAAHSALRKALRENDPRIREAAIAWNANDLDEYMRLAKAIIAEKHFSQDDVVMAIRAEASALAPDTGSSSTSKARGLFTAEKFVSAIAQGDEATANAAKTDIIQTAQTNGKTEEEAEKSFVSSVKSEMKKRFLEGTLTEDQAIDTLIDYCGETQEDAEEYVGQWAFQKEYGFSWSDRGDAYKSGQISAAELIDILVNVGGKTEDEAMWQVKIYDWQNEGFDIDSNQKSVVEDYETFCEPAGIDKHTYFNAYLFYADSGEEGVAYSKTIECMPYIDSLPLSSYQKTALAKCWWAESTVNKYKTW